MTSSLSPDSDQPAPDHTARPAAGSRWVADAERYDQWFDQPWGHFASRVEREAVLAAAGDLTNRVVADIGCGTGRLTAHLEHIAGKVVGIEPDQAMLAVATHRVRGPLLVGDGHRLPIRDAAVDVAIAVTVCEFTTKPTLVFAELARITRPGGRIVVGALDRHSPWGIANRHQFDQPPWDSATFLSATDLTNLGTPHGPTTVSPALYAPAPLPLIETWGPALETLGRRLAPHWAAFNVLTVTRSHTP